MAAALPCALLSGVKFEEVANCTAGYSGADLQAIVNNAQLEAVHAVLEVEKERFKAAAAAPQPQQPPPPPGVAPRVEVTMDMIRTATAGSRASVLMTRNPMRDSGLPASQPAPHPAC